MLICTGFGLIKYIDTNSLAKNCYACHSVYDTKVVLSKADTLLKEKGTFSFFPRVMLLFMVILLST